MAAWALWTAVAVGTVTLAGAASESVFSQETSDGNWLVERHTWDRAVDGATAVAITNRLGDVRVRGFAGQSVEIIAYSQRHPDDPRRYEVSFGERNGILQIEPRFADAVSTEPGDRPTGKLREPTAWGKRRIDVTVSVPQQVSTKVETTAGFAEVRGVAAALELRSTTGSLSVRTGGDANATSDHGEITIFYTALHWQRAQRFETRTGAISVHLPWHASFDAHLESRGEVTSDYSTELQWQEGRNEGSRLKSVRIHAGAAESDKNTLGNTENRIELSSHSGDLRLLRRGPEG